MRNHVIFPIFRTSDIFLFTRHRKNCYFNDAPLWLRQVFMEIWIIMNRLKFATMSVPLNINKSNLVLIMYILYIDNVPFADTIKFCRTLLELRIMSRMSYLWNLNVSSVLIFKLCKETRLLSRVPCQTLLSDWLAFFFFGNTIHKMSCKGYISICLHQ